MSGFRSSFSLSQGTTRNLEYVSLVYPGRVAGGCVSSMTTGKRHIQSATTPSCRSSSVLVPPFCLASLANYLAMRAPVVLAKSKGTKRYRSAEQSPLTATTVRHRRIATTVTHMLTAATRSGVVLSRLQADILKSRTAPGHVSANNGYFAPFPFTISVSSLDIRSHSLLICRGHPHDCHEECAQNFGFQGSDACETDSNPTNKHRLAR